MYSEFYVEEDDEKFVMAMAGCNSGDTLIRDDIAKKRQNALTKKAYPWWFNRVGIPYYRIHAAIINEIFKELGLSIKLQWGEQYDDQNGCYAP